jgi:hypothetical protein
MESENESVESADRYQAPLRWYQERLAYLRNLKALLALRNFTLVERAELELLRCVFERARAYANRPTSVELRLRLEWSLREFDEHLESRRPKEVGCDDKARRKE